MILEWREIREDMLHKVHTLTDEEFDHIKSHIEIGPSILQPIKELGDIMSWIRRHHERYDGSGYPAGLKGSEIPVASRIIAVADTFVALTSQRAYRQEWPVDKALAEMKLMKSRELDPEITDLFLNLFEVNFASDLHSKVREVESMMRNISGI